MLNWLITNWRDVLNILGFVLNIVGLYFTVYVLFVSKRAEQAALEAKHGIERKSAAEDLRDCNGDLGLVTLLCDHGKWDIAAFICNRLIERLTFISNRWAMHFAKDTRDEFN